jgi:hypothetical protein
MSSQGAPVRHTTRVRHLTVALVGAALCLVLAACSSPTHPKSSKASTTTTVVKKTKGSTTVPGALQVPFNPAKNARSDVIVQGGCTHDAKGDWVLNGIVQNPKHAPTGFSIVVDFVKLPGDTVLDTKIIKVKPVAYRQTAHWTASWTSSRKSLACVIRQAERQ